MGKINRLGDELQMTIEYNGRRYELINIRVKPALLKGVLPISLRTPFMFVGLNRLARIPATCRVAPTHVTTFDRKTYNYQMNNCLLLSWLGSSKENSRKLRFLLVLLRFL